MTYSETIQNYPTSGRVFCKLHVQSNLDCGTQKDIIYQDMVAACWKANKREKRQKLTNN